MTTDNRRRSSARTYIWASTLGFVGFLCGYFGQAFLLANPGISAPVLGIFTGPLGLFVGVLLGEWSARLQLRTGQNLFFLFIAMIAVAVGTLYWAVSKYSPTIRLVDAEIVGCEQVDKLLANKTKFWSEMVVLPANTRSARPNWEQEISNMLSVQPGVVLTMRIYQEAWIEEQQWRWGGVSQRVDNWHGVNETKQVFAAIAGPVPRSPCERFALGERRFSALVWERTHSTPPEKLPAFLRLDVLQQVPPEYVRFLPSTN